MNEAPTNGSILVIEDEPDLRDGLRHNLELDGFDVDTAATGTEGMTKVLEQEHTLILLDLMLPGISGLDILRRMRDEGRNTPVIIISARGQDQDKIAGLELGADDYVTKPFGLAELSARIRAVLRRVQLPATTATGSDPTGEPMQDLYEFPGLTVDFRRYAVNRNGSESQLSRYEAEILRLLIQRRGEVVTRGDLLSKVWGYVHLPTTRTVDNHIARLRKKIEEAPEDPTHVITVHGIGYRFESKEAGDS